MTPYRASKKRLEEWEAVFRALAHPARRQILLILHYRGGSMSAGDVAARFSHAWPTTTRHLGVLQKAGLVTRTREGREQRYELCREHLLGVTGDWLGAFG